GSRLRPPHRRIASAGRAPAREGRDPRPPADGRRRSLRVARGPTRAGPRGRGSDAGRRLPTPVRDPPRREGAPDAPSRAAHGPRASRRRRAAPDAATLSRREQTVGQPALVAAGEPRRSSTATWPRSAPPRITITGSSIITDCGTSVITASSLASI